MRKRKTIEVRYLVEHANHMLEHSIDEYEKGRAAVSIFIEDVLMETGNYSGFQYINGWPNNDETRRHYYMAGTTI